MIQPTLPEHQEYQAKSSLIYQKNNNKAKLWLLAKLTEQKKGRGKCNMTLEFLITQERRIARVTMRPDLKHAIQLPGPIPIYNCFFEYFFFLGIFFFNFPSFFW